MSEPLRGGFKGSVFQQRTNSSVTSKLDLLAFPNQLEDYPQGILRPGPVLLNEMRARMPKRITEDPRHQNHIIKLTCHWDEVRHDVQWQSKDKGPSLQARSC